MTRVLVTGGSRGIGRSICLRIAADALRRGEQPRLVVSATGASPDLAALVAELQALGAEALAVTGDLSDPAFPARLVASAVEFCGGLDTLVHNAGGAIAAPLIKGALADWDTVFAINTRAFLLLGQAANAELRKSRGSLCAIGSAASETVQPYTGAYNAAKAALAMLVCQMAYEWGRHGIRVNCVSPGLTLSRSTEDALASDEDRARAGSHIPLRRVASPEDVAAAVAFVTGSDAGYITGENINVDGGLRHNGTEAMLGDRPDAWAANDSARLRPKGE